MRKNERRLRRSHLKGPALSLQLQACTERSGVDAMILADGDGLVVASSAWNDDSTEQIAAQMANVGVHQFRVATLREGGLPRTVAARGFQAGEQELVVCAVGCPTERTLGELYAAIGGIQRILAA